MLTLNLYAHKKSHKFLNKINETSQNILGGAIWLIVNNGNQVNKFQNQQLMLPMMLMDAMVALFTWKKVKDFQQLNTLVAITLKVNSLY